MAFREVTMLEIKEVLRLWLAGKSRKGIARQVRVDRNTVRRYIRAAQREGLSPEAGIVLTDEQVAAVIIRLGAGPPRPRGEAWSICEARRSFIAKKVGEGLKLTRVHRLLRRNGVDVPYATLHRFAIAELDFGRKAPTIPVADCEPGSELQVDTGWMTLLEPDILGKRRRFKAWIFTSVHTRHRFVYPTFTETTADAIEACEAAWRYFGGVFHVLIPDNTKAIVQVADPLDATVTQAFLEYAQDRGFEIDPTRVRSPKDKARVERSVPIVREDCFRGEKLSTIVQARERALQWSRDEYGARRHRRTQRFPIEHFEAVEKSALLPMPAEHYDIPHWCDPKVGVDQHAEVLKALYSLPRDYLRQRVRARADQKTVRFYKRRVLIAVHPRKPPGEASTLPEHFPPEQYATAQRDLDFWRRQAAERGAAIGRFAEALLAGKQPWTKVRRVFALLGLCRRFGDERVEQVCVEALDVDMTDVRRLRRMLLRASSEPGPGLAKVVPIARYLRPTHQFALPLAERSSTSKPKGDDNDH